MSEASIFSNTSFAGGGRSLVAPVAIEGSFRKFFFLPIFITGTGGDLISGTNAFDKVISSHFDQGNPYHYEYYFDDAFYMLVGMDPLIKQSHFYIDRDAELENRVFDELITSKGITDYLFVHEKPEQNVILSREKMEQGLPIVTADPKYGMFELLKVIENAKSVNIISSSFLSLMMCKQFNQNVVAHMYCDRPYIAPYIKKHNIEVLL